tara:strand:+ start:330 stop:773 length:444 start_codon:yes stop_codon:yes gene_type:complete
MYSSYPEGWRIKYQNTFKGFLNEMWHGMRQRSEKIYKTRKIKREINITKEEFYELWEQHLTKYGPCCRYTGSKLTTIRSFKDNKDLRRKKRTPYPTNISIDRVDPRKPYDKNNIVFCSWEFNSRKSGVTPDDCKRILEIYEEMNGKN